MSFFYINETTRNADNWSKGLCICFCKTFNWKYIKWEILVHVQKNYLQIKKLDPFLIAIMGPTNGCLYNLLFLFWWWSNQKISCSLLPQTLFPRSLLNLFPKNYILFGLLIWIFFTCSARSRITIILHYYQLSCIILASLQKSYIS